MSTMMTRRQLVRAALATGAVLGSGVPRARAVAFDLIIRNGRVIDPSVGLDAVHDVAIAGGKIAAVSPPIVGDAAQTIEARGKLVVPGLIASHTHDVLS